VKTNFAGIDLEMPREKFQTLSKFYEYHLTKQSPEEKLNFLEKTILKRKSLIVVSGVGKKRQQKAALKRLKKSQKRGQLIPGAIGTQCPVYKCFRDFPDEDSLLRHYNEVHADLRALGIELV
jgi:hypothetical protein